MAKLRVGTDGTAGTYIMVPSDQSNALMMYLSGYGVTGTLDRGAIQAEGKEYTDVVNLGMGADIEGVQDLLNNWQGPANVSTSHTATAAEGGSSMKFGGTADVTLEKAGAEATGSFTPPPLDFVRVSGSSTPR